MHLESGTSEEAIEIPCTTYFHTNGLTLFSCLCKKGIPALNILFGQIVLVVEEEVTIRCRHRIRIELAIDGSRFNSSGSIGLRGIIGICSIYALKCTGLNEFRQLVIGENEYISSCFYILKYIILTVCF